MPIVKICIKRKTVRWTKYNKITICHQWFTSVYQLFYHWVFFYSYKRSYFNKEGTAPTYLMHKEGTVSNIKLRLSLCQKFTEYGTGFLGNFSMKKTLDPTIEFWQKSPCPTFLSLQKSSYHKNSIHEKSCSPIICL